MLRSYFQIFQLDFSWEDRASFRLEIYVHIYGVATKHDWVGFFLVEKWPQFIILFSSFVSSSLQIATVSKGSGKIQQSNRIQSCFLPIRKWENIYKKDQID